jgi:DNA-3-methyladenine glycosylase I
VFGIDGLADTHSIYRVGTDYHKIIENAKAFIKIQDEFGSFDAYLWGFTSSKTIQNRFTSIKEIPARTELSDIISKDLLKRGFTFVGSTIIYAFLQAAGIVNDHTTDCFRHGQLL